LAQVKQNDGELMASFGGARLVKKLSGKIVLLGGSDKDRADAVDWCSKFLKGARVFPTE